MQVWDCSNSIIIIIKKMHKAHDGAFPFLLVRKAETSHLGQGQGHVLAANNPSN